MKHRLDAIVVRASRPQSGGAVMAVPLLDQSPDRRIARSTMNSTDPFISMGTRLVSGCSRAQTRKTSSAKP